MGECSFWYRPTRVVPDQRPLNGRCCCCCTIAVDDAVSTTAPNAGTVFTPSNGPLSGTTRVSRNQKGKSNLDFTEARDTEWRWHQLGHMQVCTSLQTDNHASNPPLSFLQARCPSCCPTNSVKALKIHFDYAVISNYKFLSS